MRVGAVREHHHRPLLCRYKPPSELVRSPTQATQTGAGVADGSAGVGFVAVKVLGLLSQAQGLGPPRCSPWRALVTRVTQTPPDISTCDGQTRTAVPPWPAETQRIWTRSDRANGLHFSTDQKVGGSSPSERAPVPAGQGLNIQLRRVLDGAARRCAMTVPAAASTGMPPTASPPTSPEPPVSSQLPTSRLRLEPQRRAPWVRDRSWPGVRSRAAALRVIWRMTTLPLIGADVSYMRRIPTPRGSADGLNRRSRRPGCSRSRRVSRCCHAAGVSAGSLLACRQSRGRHVQEAVDQRRSHPGGPAIRPPGWRPR